MLATNDVGTRHAAFSALCCRYWMPIYASVRRQGYVQADAEDLTQGFFQHLIEHEAVARADRTRGRFRGFLLGALRHYLADQNDRRHARKRGGGCQTIAFDTAAIDAELTYLRDVLAAEAAG